MLPSLNTPYIFAAIFYVQPLIMPLHCCIQVSNLNFCYKNKQSLTLHDFSLTALLHCKNADEQWWFTCVYGPQGDAEKTQFLDHLRHTRRGCAGPWLLCGDFNLIYKAEDKNNMILNRRLMGRFRIFLDDVEVHELHLYGRRFTWSNGRDNPTLERLDRVFASDEWLLSLPNHTLTALASECSDHAPLRLSTVAATHTFKRFHFESIWPKFDRFLQTISEAWVCPWTNADIFQGA